MSDYLITFRGYIDERKRPENFPKVVEDMVFIRANNFDDVAKAVNNYSSVYIRLQGMSVRPDAHSLEDFTILDTERMWVPMHMITHFTADVKAVTGNMPVLDITGRIEIPEGQKLVKN